MKQILLNEATLDHSALEKAGQIKEQLLAGNFDNQKIVEDILNIAALIPQEDEYLYQIDERYDIYRDAFDYLFDTNTLVLELISERFQTINFKKNLTSEDMEMHKKAVHFLKLANLGTVCPSEFSHDYFVFVDSLTNACRYVSVMGVNNSIPLNYISETFIDNLKLVTITRDIFKFGVFSLNSTYNFADIISNVLLYQNKYWLFSKKLRNTNLVTDSLLSSVEGFAHRKMLDETDDLGESYAIRLILLGIVRGTNEYQKKVTKKHPSFINKKIVPVALEAYRYVRDELEKVSKPGIKYKDACDALNRMIFEQMNITFQRLQH